MVRVVSIDELSKELCGGTHLRNTGQVGLPKIIGEESVAAGTRRITALTGVAALEHVSPTESVLADTVAALKVPPAELATRVAALVKELRQLKKQQAAAPTGEQPRPMNSWPRPTRSATSGWSSRRWPVSRRPCCDS